MKKTTILQLVLLVSGLFVSSMNLNATSNTEPFDTRPPSTIYLEEETARLQKPSLRQAPDEDGTAQKEVPDDYEVPIGNIDLSVLLLLIGLAGVYVIKEQKRTLKTKKNE